MDAQPDGLKFRATIVEEITQHQRDHAKQPELVKVRISVNNDQCEETVTYTEIFHHIKKGENSSSAGMDIKAHSFLATHRTLDPGGASIWSGRMGSRP